jgi:hypothetical protein
MNINMDGQDGQDIFKYAAKQERILSGVKSNKALIFGHRLERDASPARITAKITY